MAPLPLCNPNEASSHIRQAFLQEGLIFIIGALLLHFFQDFIILFGPFFVKFLLVGGKMIEEF